MEDGKIDTYYKRLLSGDLVKGSDKSYDKFVPEMVELREEDVEKNHLSFEVAIWLGLLGADNLAPFSERLGTLPGLSKTEPARLEGLSLATFGAATRVREAGESRKANGEMVRVGYRTRTELRGFVRALQAKGIVPKDTIAKLNLGNGFSTVGKDLIDLGRVLEKNWPEYERVALYSKADIAEIKALGGALFSIWVQERRVNRGLTPAAMLSRSYTMLKKQYVKLKRATEYLLGGEVDVDALIPPFATPKSNRPSPKVVETEVGDTSTDVEATADVEVSADTEPSTEAATTPAPAEVAATPVATEVPEVSETTPAAAAEPASTSTPSPAPAPCEVEPS